MSVRGGHGGLQAGRGAVDAQLSSLTGIRWGDISATTVLSTLPPILFAVFAQRYLVTGLSSGAVKG